MLGPSRGRVPFARRVLPAEKEKAADSQLIILMWKAEGFLLASDFSEELNIIFSFQLSTWGERGEARVLLGGASSQPRFCFTKPGPQKGALPPWKGNLWDLPRLLGNLYRNSPETFTQPPTGKRGENKKTGPPAWENQAGNPAFSRRMPWTSTVRVV